MSKFNMSNLLVIQPKNYVLNAVQLENFALEYFGHRTKSIATINNMEFTFENEKNMSDFEKVLNSTFTKKK